MQLSPEGQGRGREFKQANQQHARGLCYNHVYIMFSLEILNIYINLLGSFIHSCLVYGSHMLGIQLARNCLFHCIAIVR